MNFIPKDQFKCHPTGLRYARVVDSSQNRGGISQVRALIGEIITVRPRAFGEPRYTITNAPNDESPASRAYRHLENDRWYFVDGELELLDEVLL